MLSLHNDILVIICSYLNICAMSNLLSVCRALRRLSPHIAIKKTSRQYARIKTIIRTYHVPRFNIVENIIGQGVFINNIGDFGPMCVIPDYKKSDVYILYVNARLRVRKILFIIFEYSYRRVFAFIFEKHFSMNYIIDLCLSETKLFGTIGTWGERKVLLEQEIEDFIYEHVTLSNWSSILTNSAVTEFIRNI